jgi:hypothetical protein
LKGTASRPAAERIKGDSMPAILQAAEVFVD